MADENLEKVRSTNRGLYNAVGGAWSAAFETALAPLVVAGIGWLLDRWLGITPVLTIVFLIVGAAGSGIRLYYGYQNRMKVEEANRPWAPQHPDWAKDDKEW